MYLRGGLIAFTRDTLASNMIAGFKEGVGFSKKVCRTCEASRKQLKNLLMESDCILRDEDEHKRRCAVLKSALVDRARKYWSKMYGVNHASVLLGLLGFKDTECFCMILCTCYLKV